MNQVIWGRLKTANDRMTQYDICSNSTGSGKETLVVKHKAL